MDTHRIQDMHLLLSETLRLSVEMALAGHFSAHCPQDVQAEPAFGIIPAPAFLYGLLPGIDGLECCRRIKKSSIFTTSHLNWLFFYL